MGELRPYMAFIAIFAAAFGITFQSIIIKTVEPNVYYTSRAFSKVFWAIFGEFSILDDIDSK